MTIRKWFFTLTGLLLIALLPLTLDGCGAGGAGGGGPTINLGGTGSGSGATAVGTSVCIQCHSGTPSNQFQATDATDSSATSPTYYDRYANGGIGTNYQLGLHNGEASTSAPACETCHGNGSQHYGTGPIPEYQPGAAVCGSCHSTTYSTFASTAHANSNNSPDKYFGQGGTGTDQANLPPGEDMSVAGSPEFKSDGTTAVTKNEHIEECSACHNYSTKATHVASGDVVDPPTVRCGSCHDPHMPVATTRNDVITRSSSAAAPKGTVKPQVTLNFKPQRVNNDSGVDMFGAKNLSSGTWIRPRTHYDYHVGADPNVTYSGYGQQATAGDWLRLSSERLCAACHTKGSYLYGAFSGTTAVSRTHNKDVFNQYEKSGHASKGALAFKKFSLLGDPAADASYRPQYPYDQGKTDGGKSVGLHNGSSSIGGSCGQCHHGVMSLAWQKGIQHGLPNTVAPLKWVSHYPLSANPNAFPNGYGDTDTSPVVWGDSTVTCITCHEPHGGSTGTTKNIRVPKKLSYNQLFQTGLGNQFPGVGFQDYAPSGSTTPNIRAQVNKMLDLTDIPSGAGNSIICLLCHQGRESGWTVWNKIRIYRQYMNNPVEDDTTASNFMYNSPDTTISNVPANAFSFVNPHYFEGGAQLWSRNAFEFGGKQYSSGNTSHQQKNCTGCHMDTPNAGGSAGGHTWIPQIGTCQQCHPGANSFRDIMASADYNANGAVETAFNEIGEVSKIARGTDPNTPGLYGSGTGGTGLLGLLNEALYVQGIRYDPDSNPYFFKSSDAAGGPNNNYTDYTPNRVGSAFNLQYSWKTGGAVHVHNTKYTVELLIDSLEAIGRTQSPSARPFATNRPTGDRANTDYRNLKP